MMLHAIKRHFLEILPPTVFFLIAFGLLFATRQLILREYGISLQGFGMTVVGAMLVGKVVMYVDKLPFIDRFPNHPLIYNACWKSSVYFAASLVVRYLRHVVPLLGHHESLEQANLDFMNTTVWPQFWLVQMWLAVLFLVYCATRELVRAIGHDKVVGLFFRRGGAAAARS